MDNCEVEEQFWNNEGAHTGIEWFQTFRDFRIAFRKRQAKKVQFSVVTKPPSYYFKLRVSHCAGHLLKSTEISFLKGDRLSSELFIKGCNLQRLHGLLKPLINKTSASNFLRIEIATLMKKRAFNGRRWENIWKVQIKCLEASLLIFSR